MQINNNYSPNFSGTFRIKPNEVMAKAEIPKLFNKNRQVFYNVKEDGDMFIVLRDKTDKKFCRYLTDNKIKDVEYYPEINTSSGLDPEHPKGLKKLLKSSKVFSDIKQIKMRILQMAFSTGKQDYREQLSNIINSMRLNIEHPKITLSDEMTVVRDDAKKRTLYIITPNSSIHYAYLRPDDINLYPTRRCTINNKGEIIKEYEDLKDFLAFDKKFSALRKLSLNTLK